VVKIDGVLRQVVIVVGATAAYSPVSRRRDLQSSSIRCGRQPGTVHRNSSLAWASSWVQAAGHRPRISSYHSMRFRGRSLDGPRPDWMTDRDLIYRAYVYASSFGLNKEKNQIEKAFAESADGDFVAAHIAFGNDYLCTDDRGISAAAASIFDANNRSWLKSQYGVKIVSAQELADLL
jgi:hypothetical protein